ncbi:MAG TPA: polysaccharide deacetylase family protein [Vicinamibacterales bacterium]
MALAALAIGVGALAPIDGQTPAPPSPKIALTFDDLPVHGPLPPGLTRVQVTKQIVDALVKHGVPQAYGFVNGKALDEDPQHAGVLQLWRDAGFPLGNHGWSHMDLHASTVEAFEQEILLNEPVLRRFMGDGDWRWFRFPFLREGDTPAKYDAVRKLLAGHGYRVAQVTVSFDDYAYNDPYVRCLAAGDREALAWLERNYLDRAGESLERSRDAAVRIFGRDINHVMLLHVGAFQTVMLPRLLDLLRDRGFAVIALEEAQADEAYRAVPQRPGPRAGTWLDQVEANPSPRSPGSADVFARLQSLCRAASG